MIEFLIIFTNIKSKLTNKMPRIKCWRTFFCLFIPLIYPLTKQTPMLQYIRMLCFLIEFYVLVDKNKMFTRPRPNWNWIIENGMFFKGFPCYNVRWHGEQKSKVQIKYEMANAVYAFRSSCAHEWRGKIYLFAIYEVNDTNETFCYQ